MGEAARVLIADAQDDITTEGGRGSVDAAEETRGENEEEPSASAPAGERKRGPFGGLTASEAAHRRAEVARERRAARERNADAAMLSARQRFGIALSKLDQDEVDAIVQALAKDAKAGDVKAVGALARLADQAFGKPQPEDVDDAGGDEVARMTRQERSALIARLQEEEREQRSAAGEESDPRGEM